MDVVFDALVAKPIKRQFAAGGDNGYGFVFGFFVGPLFFLSWAGGGTALLCSWAGSRRGRSCQVEEHRSAVPRQTGNTPTSVTTSNTT